jgi:hypothetical protein
MVTIDAYLEKISIVRCEIHHYTFIFKFVQVGVLNIQRCKKKNQDYEDMIYEYVVIGVLVKMGIKIKKIF